VAAGIERVVYVERYPKSLALALHPDSIVLENPEAKQRVNSCLSKGHAAISTSSRCA
jgi:deoxycytidylate deaminase